MKRTVADYVFRSLLYIVLMNAFMFVLCVIFKSDFEPTFIGNVVVPVICAYASFWGEDLRARRLALKKGQR